MKGSAEIGGFRVRWASPGLLLLFAFLAVYYYWSVQPHLTQIPQDHGFYNQLAEAFLHGQTNLLTDPDPRLLALADPYDPAQNVDYRVHDLSLYRGRYYAYYGPAAAALLFAPFRVLFRRELPDRVGTALFALGALIAGCQVLRMLTARWYPATPRWLFYLLAFALGFCNTVPFLLRRPAVYEVAIASSQFFLLTGVALIVEAACRASVRWSLAAGAALGCAVLARASLLVAMGIIVLVYVLDRQDDRRQRRAKLIAAVLPVIAAVLVFAVYNYVRFDSPFEFGTLYQLAGVHPMHQVMFKAERIPQHLYLYLLYPPKLRSTFPFVFAQEPSWPPGNTFMGFEAIVGLPWVCPLVAFLIGVRRALHAEARWTVGLFIVSSALLLLVDMSVYATMRYQADVAALLFLASAVGVMAIRQKCQAGRTFDVAVAAAATMGIAVNAAIGLMGYYGGLPTSAPEQFHMLQTLANPIAALLRWCGVGA